MSKRKYHFVFSYMAIPEEGQNIYGNIDFLFSEYPNVSDFDETLQAIKVKVEKDFSQKLKGVIVLNMMKLSTRGV